MSIITDRIATATPADFTRAIIVNAITPFGVTYQDVMGKRRYKAHASARAAAITAVHLARPDWSYPDLGRVFGLDHSTIIHHIQQCGAWRPSNRGPYYNNKRHQERARKAAGITQTERTNDEFVPTEEEGTGNGAITD